VRIIVQAFGRAWAAEFSLAQVKVRQAGEIQDDSDEDEPRDEETLRYDPRSTTSCHMERRTDMEDAYGKVPFGFTSQERVAELRAKALAADIETISDPAELTRRSLEAHFAVINGREA
jgi:hypothetical protein